MEDYEKLGAFYLGRPYDLQAKRPKSGLVLYDSRDLVTHAVCVGMTGSGKTGLCVGLIEEAAIDGIPAIIIDPKGDLSNLLLTFPDLRTEDFVPWVNPDDARSKSLSSEQYANQQAELWRKGLAEWRQDGERIRRLRDTADFVIYTPGSNAGLPVSILKSFAAPALAILQDRELIRERIGVTATSLLALLGIDGNPIQSREHILISTILDSSWKQGQDLDLTTLIQQIQAPPMTRIGALDVESFFPAKERFHLAMLLNNLMASPGFEAWLEGDALDIDQFLHTPEGKPRVSIFSIAHLGDAERMFFVSLLLNQILSWVRAQSGTTSLRAILYMDEIFGYFPPTANPPSKTPLLTLLKQARAFGMGIVLATQNPVDLDYKGLANAGTWFIGRLQTERDKARLLDGLEGIKFDRPAMQRILAGLGNRVFLMNNVHEDTPEIFETRWTMSYLRGPLSRDQIKALMEGRKRDSDTRLVGEEARSPLAALPASESPPVLPPDIRPYFVPVRGSQPKGSTLLYRPMLLSAGQVRFVDPKTQTDLTQDVMYVVPITEDAVPVDWGNAAAVDLGVADLDATASPSRAQYAKLPGPAARPKNYNSWSRDFASWLFGSQKLQFLRSPSTNLISEPGEPERDFRIRIQHSAREARDRSIANLRTDYAPKVTALEERIRRAQQAEQREADQASQQKLQTVVSFGTAVLGAVLGRKAISASTLGRAATTVRAAGRSWKEAQDVERASETVAALRQQLADLESQLQAETTALQSKMDAATEALETIAIRLKKQNISVRLVTLAWVPFWQQTDGTIAPAWQ